MRAERAAQAAALRAQGLNGVQIAERLGISRTYAYSLLADPDGSLDRERKRRYRRACANCGEPCAGPANRSRGSVGRYCFPCGSAIGARRSAEAAARKAAPKYERIVELWRQGATYAQIAAAVGSTPGAINVTVVRLRARGWDLPKRGPGRPPRSPQPTDEREAHESLQ